jgi:hypothetical protein
MRLRREEARLLSQPAQVEQDYHQHKSHYRTYCFSFDSSEFESGSNVLLALAGVYDDAQN